ncbi:CapA family protein [Psychrobacter pacificensis]|uniref:CapA family protein n=1 Tax=Psychrobacter pacificensis TaxID=112002 RepID=UPI001CBBFD9B|nr:CapA family protein [Psychrobacter pacificensis]MBZ1392369.1 CapA family protein [Psychrobacter pacificensis]
MNIIIAGDFCPYNRVQDLITENNFGDIVSNEVKEVFTRSDISIVNLECPIIGDASTSISKIGPNIKANKSSFSFLNYLGVNAVTLSNNHIMDYGTEGLKSTIEGCIENSIDYLGAGESFSEARKPLYIKSNSETIAFLNISENEFSTTHDNQPGANPLDLVSNYYDIIEAKKNSDYLILIYHGGHEGYKYPSPRMKKTFRYFIDLGVDIVVCHHSHCYSGYEKYKSKHIYYGLGNFIFDWPGSNNRPWNYGYFLEIETTSNQIELHPYIQSNIDVQLKPLNNKQKDIFLEDIDSINNIIINDSLLENQFLKLARERAKSYLSPMQPYPGYLLGGAYRRGVLPSIISKKKLLTYLNVSRCESHRDLYLETLNQMILK